MARRVVAVLIVVFALAPFANAAGNRQRVPAPVEDPDCIQAETPLPLSAPFASTALRIIAGPKGMQTADAPNVEVLVARVNTDGTIATACVGTEEAARDFMSGRKKLAGPEKE